MWPSSADSNTGVNMRINIISAIIPFIGINSCVSTPQNNRPENTPDVVYERIDQLGARPEWLHESEPFRIVDGQVIVLGSTTIPATDRVDGGYRIAENNAKSLIAGAIEQRLEFIFQNAEEGVALDTTQARYIGAEASKITSSSLRPGKRYWEKVATTTDEGQRVTRYRIFTSITMPEPDFRHAVIDAVNRSKGKGGLSADFAKKVDAHWDKFTEGVPSAKPNKP